MVDMSFELFQRKLEDTDLIHYATVDFINPSKITKGASVTLGGVVVLKNSAPKSCELFLDVKTEKIKVNWGIESPKMRQMYPDSINSSHSRFIVDFIWPKEINAVVLTLKTPEGNFIPLIELFLYTGSKEDHYKIWKMNLHEEIHFWELIISGKHPNKEWVEDFRWRAKGIDVVPPHLIKYVNKYRRILDVGSGPATVFGRIFNGQPIDVTAVDPLAEIYIQLCEKYGVSLAVKPIYGEAENLVNFVDGKFDLVYSRNAIDHSYDPIKAIQSMIDVCSNGGLVFLENRINEGCAGEYQGLHQWNFMPASGDLIIWKRDGSGYIASRVLNGFKELHAYVIRPGWVAVEIKC